MFMQQARDRFFKVFGAPSLFGAQLAGGKNLPVGNGQQKKPPGPFPEAFGAKYENSALAELQGVGADPAKHPVISSLST